MNMQKNYLLTINKDTSRDFFFDLDWTLYKYDKWVYHGSQIYNSRKRASEKLIAELWLTLKIAELRIAHAWRSLFEILNSECSLSEEDYNIAIWSNVDPAAIISKEDKSTAKKILKKTNTASIVSDSPLIWINKAIDYLDIFDKITKVYHGTHEINKTNRKIYEWIAFEGYGWELFMIGDNYDLDIVWSKIHWFSPIYVSQVPPTHYQTDHILYLKDIKMLLDVL